MVHTLMMGLAIVSIIGCPVLAVEFKQGPPHPDYNPNRLNEGGYMAPEFDDTFLQAPANLDLSAIRDTMDWRSSAPAVRDQATCNTCWIFATCGDLEMQLNIMGQGLTDFSEDHLKECNAYGTRCAGAGNWWKSGDYLTLSGARLESCQPYHSYNYQCLDACQPVTRVREFRSVANTVAAIKAALATGPVVTSLNADAWGSSFYSYNGTYVLNGGSGTTNHSVVIVGYDDPRFPEGHWICRNSWGTSWGDGGYFYITYGSGSIGTSSCQFTQFEQPLSLQGLDLLYHDTQGCYAYYGTGSDNTTWGAVKFVPTYTGTLRRVEFVSLGSNFDYTITIYDSKSGSSPSIRLNNQLYTTTVANVARGGYLSVDVSPPLAITAGNDIYIAVQFNTPGGVGYPVPVDNYGSTEGESVLSFTGTGATWQTVPVDICIRAVTSNPNAFVPTLTPIGGLILLVLLSAFLVRRYV